ncbi:MAG: hypothetical protein IKE70_01945 [Bacilli bacterium]|nr:hypothetical protein [Bacilli bacterium]
MDPLLENYEIISTIIDFNRKVYLDHKDYIKKYYKVRKLHSVIINNMMNYMGMGKHPIDEYFYKIMNDVAIETNYRKIELDNTKHDDAVIFNELFIYKTHENLPSLTELYLEKKKFKGPNKVKLLNAMNNSFVSLFKIIDCDHETGYVTYEDVFTKKKYKIIDVAMSSLANINNKKEKYAYERLITYEDITFSTGLPLMFEINDKKIVSFIKKYKKEKCSDFSKCVILYDLSKKSKIRNRNYYEY